MESHQKPGQNSGEDMGYAYNYVQVDNIWRNLNKLAKEHVYGHMFVYIESQIKIEHWEKHMQACIGSDLYQDKDQDGIMGMD